MEHNHSQSEPERVLFVHAHPDDETIFTGGTIADLVDRGASVTVLTCTRGELGEVIPQDIRHLEGTTQLAEHRSGELAAALAVLGVTDHRFLGAADARWKGRPPRRYIDSGMRWGDEGAEALETVDEGSLTGAPFGEVAADIAAVIEAVGATAVVSYDANGGYGHPDHVRAREASVRAAEVMEVPFFSIESGESVQAIALSVDVTGVLARKTDALRAHRSQLTVDGDRFTFSNGESHPIDAVERYSRARPAQVERVAWKDQGLGTHVFAYVLAVIVGLVVGGIAAVDHRFSPVWFGQPVPVGIIATLAIVAALLVGLRIVFDGRLVASLAAVGIIGAISVLSLTGGGGSVLVAADTLGYLLVFGPIVIAFFALGWPAAGTFRRDKIGNRPEPKGTPHQ